MGFLKEPNFDIQSTGEAILELIWVGGTHRPLSYVTDTKQHDSKSGNQNIVLWVW